MLREDQVVEVVEALATGVSARAVARAVGVSRGSVHRVARGNVACGRADGAAGGGAAVRGVCAQCGYRGWIPCVACGAKSWLGSHSSTGGAGFEGSLGLELRGEYEERYERVKAAKELAEEVEPEVVWPRVWGRGVRVG